MGSQELLLHAPAHLSLTPSRVRTHTRRASRVLTSMCMRSGWTGMRSYA